MNILGAILRTDEIIGIGPLTEVHNGNRFYYSFSVITKSSSVPFNSMIIEDVAIATKFEQQDLAEFKQQYAFYNNKIAVMVGDDVAILQEQYRIDKLDLEYKNFCTGTDKLNALIKKSKGKTKEEMIKLLGDVWAAGKEIKELAI